jgi:hypothetical protein
VGAVEDVEARRGPFRMATAMALASATGLGWYRISSW